MLDAGVIEHREEAAESLRQGAVNVALANGLVSDAYLNEPGLRGWAADMFLNLRKLERKIEAAKIMLRVGLLPDQSIPDSAAPLLQSLIHCRSHLPGPVYDHMFQVRVRDGRAFVVECPEHGESDKHYFEQVAGPVCAVAMATLPRAKGGA